MDEAIATLLARINAYEGIQFRAAVDLPSGGGRDECPGRSSAPTSLMRPAS
ncbi:MAG: hypothetical protein WDM96_02325 [Lacunisphaera sp.]